MIWNLQLSNKTKHLQQTQQNSIQQRHQNKMTNQLKDATTDDNKSQRCVR